MATNALIAKNYGEGFEGVFHYRDGDPAVLGAELFKKHRRDFRKNTGRMVAALVDEKIDNGEDFFDEARVFEGTVDVQYVYNIEEATGRMQVLKKSQKNCLAACEWVALADVDLNGNEPDWKKIDALVEA